ncbi:hypothetical protein [Brevibacillus sp. 1238]|uniref:hypothetical protein n=1 Tax=Brevibacillus sp. 1238 TaxID=2940565 RepID=UPI002474F90B|nr:hypothetical protein [Brevibacillus sp. 1238]MDH6351894.1 hypothetical protein [Brevibacillus sp. 1238]
MVDEVSELAGSVPVKVPIPRRLLLIEDEAERSTAMRQWWVAYASRYPDYKAERKDSQFVYMLKR